MCNYRDILINEVNVDKMCLKDGIKSKDVRCEQLFSFVCNCPYQVKRIKSDAFNLIIYWTSDFTRSKNKN